MNRENIKGLVAYLADNEQKGYTRFCLKILYELLNNSIQPLTGDDMLNFFEKKFKDDEIEKKYGGFDTVCNELMNQSATITFKIDNSTGSSPFGQRNNLFTEFALVNAAPLDTQKRVIAKVFEDDPELVHHFLTEMDSTGEGAFQRIFCKLDIGNFQRMCNWLSLGISLNSLDA